MIRGLLRRRVPQIVIAYIVAGWGIVQFVGFLEQRYALAPAWVDLTGLTVLLFVPTMLVVGWTHGAPGADQFNRRQIAAIVANLGAAIVVLLLVFGQSDFGGIFETIDIANEDGTTTKIERPRANYRTSITNFAFDLPAEHMEYEWTRAGLAYLLELDLSQDPFIDMRSAFQHAEAARRAGIEDLSRIPRPLQRKISQDAHTRFFLGGEIDRVENDYVVRFKIYDSESGREHAQGELRSVDLFTLADLLSIEIRRGADVAATSLKNSPDLPVSDLATSSLEALRSFMLAVESMLWKNDFATAHKHLENATSEDPTFAIAQFNLFATSTNLSLPEQADAAMEAAMQNNYRLPQRIQNLIKANYYFHREETDLGLSVLERWETVHPDDLLPKQLLAMQYKVRGRPEDAEHMYEELLRLNPSNGETWRDLGGLFQDRAKFSKARECFEKYTELYPESATGFVSLAQCLELEGHLDRARETLDRAALLDPANLSISASIGDLHAKEGEFETAEAVYLDGLDRARTAQERAELLGSFRSYCSMRHQFERAIEFFHRWSEEARQIMPPAQYEIVVAMGYSIYGDAGRFDEGLAELNAIETRLAPPLDGFVAFGRARLHLVAGHADSARVDIDQMQALVDAFGIGDLQRIVNASRAQLLDLEGDYEAAETKWNETLSDGRARIRHYVGLGRTLRKMGRSKDAAATLEAGLRLYPAHGGLNYVMAQVQADLGRSESALAHLDRALTAWAEADEDSEDVVAARTWSAQLRGR